MKPDTEVTILGPVYGSYWWPTNEPWSKPIDETRAYRPREDTYIYRAETPSLRDFVLSLTNDGDSSGACYLDPSSVLIVRRTRGDRCYSRTFPITLFKSIDDLVLDPDDVPSGFDEEY